MEGTSEVRSPLQLGREGLASSTVGLGEDEQDVLALEILTGDFVAPPKSVSRQWKAGIGAISNGFIARSPSQQADFAHIIRKVSSQNSLSTRTGICEILHSPPHNSEPVWIPHGWHLDWDRSRSVVAFFQPRASVTKV